jgi:unsaturated rhamnogalacturonyl hydrolase
VHLIIVLAIAAVVWWQAAGLSLRGAVPLSTVPPLARLPAQLDQAMRDVARTWIKTTPSSKLDYAWGEGVLMLGLQRASRNARDASARAAIDAYVHSYYAKQQGHEGAVTWSDRATPAIAAVERALLGDRTGRQAVKLALNYAMNGPRTATRGLVQHFGSSPLRHLSPPMPEAWVDSVFHVVPLLLRSAELVDEPRYREEAAKQLVGFLRALQEPHSGLLAHAYSDAPKGERGGPVPPFNEHAYWARGQGWMLASGADVWLALPREHVLRPEIEHRMKKLEKAVRAHQGKSGLFHTLIERRDVYQETAGSALILYGMSRGARYGLYGVETKRAVERGARGLLSILRRKGDRVEVPGTSLGTNPVPAIYAYVPTAAQVSYGVGAWLLAASEMLDGDVGLSHELAHEPHHAAPSAPPANVTAGSTTALKR